MDVTTHTWTLYTCSGYVWFTLSPVESFRAQSYVKVTPRALGVVFLATGQHGTYWVLSPLFSEAKQVLQPLVRDNKETKEATIAA